MRPREEVIEIRGASTHNLRAIDVTLPRGKIIAFTGVSGSGKSSLAFDTIFAEGQRRYIECLAPYVRRYLDQLPHPKVESITGLPPTLSVAQNAQAGNNPRSTVATFTEIHDFLRLLFARCGLPHCPQCGEALGAQSTSDILSDVEALPEGERIHILAPLVRGRKGQHRDEFLLIRREGFVRARLDGVLILVDSPPDIDPDKVHDLEMVVDRQVVRPGIRERLGESLETALKHGGGTVIISRDVEGEWVDRLYSTQHHCLRCQIGYREIEPRTFSFSSPYGACPRCDGLGQIADLDPTLIVPDTSLSLDAGAILPFQGTKGGLKAEFRKALAKWAEQDSWLETPYRELSDRARSILWDGQGAFEGLRTMLPKLQSSDAEESRQRLENYQQMQVCPECKGSRLAPEGRSVRIDGRAIHEVTACTISQAAHWFESLQFTGEKQEIAAPLLREIRSRLQFLDRVGTGYIELDRPTSSLSGGETQRVRLASSVGSGLNGVCYVLDEPSIGLHPRDTGRLLDVLCELRNRDNTVLVVEHDEATIAAADLIVDLGPGAGVHGGEIVQSGDWESFLNGPGLTADYLAGRKTVRDLCPATGPIHSERQLSLRGVTHRNLKNIDVDIPLGQLVCITGVSGSGKSSLILEVLVPAVRRALGLKAPLVGAHRELSGATSIQRILEVDQSPIGRSPRSTPASYAELLEPVREIFAKTREAKVRGFKASRFSANNKAGQCPHCKGIGAERIELSFLPDMFAVCPVCLGKRFNQATLEVTYRGKSIAEALSMPVDEAAVFFENHVAIHRILATLADVGLGYLKLGQWSTTLSGGEAQRLKLATELARSASNETLFVLDEPTTGLHFHDIAHLLALVRKLVAGGASVVVIEHNLDFIRSADWVIDLGPEGGIEGGKLLTAGTPEQVMRAPASYTGAALASHRHYRSP